jgi:hypothetical protein
MAYNSHGFVPDDNPHRPDPTRCAWCHRAAGDPLHPVFTNRAQRVLREVRAHFAKIGFTSEDGLNDRELFIKYDHYEYPVIYWETGPDEWAYEMASKLNDKFRAEDIDIFVECQYSFALAVFGG